MDSGTECEIDGMEPAGEVQKGSIVKKKSWIHAYFVLDKNKAEYCCNLCSKILTERRDGSTGNLHNHIKFVHKEVRPDDLNAPNAKRRKSNNSAVVTVETVRKDLTADSFSRALVDFVVETNQSFSIVEHGSFKDLISLITKNTALTRVPGRTSMTSSVQDEYHRVKQILVGQLTGLTSKVSLIIDCWTSSNELAFQGVIVRFIDESWELITIPLDLTTLSGPHSGENIAHALLPVIEEFGILDKVGSITTDNAYNMDTFFSSFGNMMEQRGYTFDVFNQRIRCLAHIINLCAKSAIECLGNDEIGKVLARLRKGVNAIRSSPQRREAFRKQCEVLKCKHLVPIADVPHRWNSTYDMIERAHEIKTAFQATLQCREDLRAFIISENEWGALVNLLEFLKPIKEATTMISKEKVPNIASATLIYQYLFTHFDRHKNYVTGTGNGLGKAATVSHAKLGKYYPDTDGKSYVIGTVLHPGFKLQWYKHAQWPASWIAKSKRLIVDEWELKYKIQSYAPSIDVETSNSEGNDFFSSLYKEQMGAAAKEPNDELAKYLAEAIVPSGQIRKTGLLGWWKIHEAEFPSLAKMAKDFLCMAGSGVPVECFFSGATDVLTDNRQSLSSANINMLMCLKAWKTYFKDT